MRFFLILFLPTILVASACSTIGPQGVRSTNDATTATKISPAPAQTEDPDTPVVPPTNEEISTVIDTATSTIIPSTTPAAETDPTSTPTPLPTEQGRPFPDLLTCEPPYQPDSIWNTPIDWTTARFHPDSDAMIDTFLAGRGYVGSNVDSYAPNIYFVDNGTPLITVQLREYSFRDAIDDRQIIYGLPAEPVAMPIPGNAAPAPGTDAQLAIINLDTGEEWGLNGGFVDAQGDWTASGAYRYHIGNSGVPPLGFGQRGAGIGQLAGIIRPCEINRGVIGHAVTLAYDDPCAPPTCEANGWPTVIPPFTRTDGRGIRASDLPMGARIVIRPEITIEQIGEACHGVTGCIVWAANMQAYGGFIVDRSGGAKTYGEGDLTAQWDEEIWHKDMLQDIPHDWYAVLDWDSRAAASR